MNTYIRSRVDRYNELRSGVDAALTRAADEHRDLTDDELAQATEARSLYEEVSPYLDDVARDEKVRALAGQLDAGRTERLGGEHRADPYAAYGGGLVVPALMPSREQVAELYRAATEQRAVRAAVDGGDHHRAAVTLSKAGDLASELDGGGLREPRRISTAAGLATQAVNGVEGVEFPVFGAGSADVAAEGASKPEYAAVTAGSATPQMISVWTDASRQVLTTVTSFDSRLRRKHAALVAKREDLLLVSTVQGTTGVQTHTGASGESRSDSLLSAAALVLSSDVGAAPDLAVINPADVPAIFGGATGTSGETPESELRLHLHGMNVYVSPAVDAGSAVVGAWSAASRFIVGMPPTVLVDAASQLKKNLVTTLTEEAVALAVDEPTGFVTVTFAAAGA